MQTPSTLVEDLLATRKNIVTTDCVYLDDDGAPADRHCDGNSWAETDASRKYLATLDASKPLFMEYGGAHGTPLHACGCFDASACFKTGHVASGRYC